MWKDLLIQTKDYRPFQHRSNDENLKEVKILRTAMNDFRNLKLCGVDVLRETHPAFAGLQAKCNIPQEFCSPEELFREEQLDYNVVYYKRCCSVYDFYNMLSRDNPCYVDRRSRRDGNANERPLSSVPPAVQSNRPEAPAAQAPIHPRQVRRDFRLTKAKNDKGALPKETHRFRRKTIQQTLMKKQICCLRISCYQRKRVKS
jgi:hypothetical protein